jgi:hypothetical protein
MVAVADVLVEQDTADAEVMRLRQSAARMPTPITTIISCSAVKPACC